MNPCFNLRRAHLEQSEGSGPAGPALFVLCAQHLQLFAVAPRLTGLSPSEHTVHRTRRKTVIVFRALQAADSGHYTTIILLYVNILTLYYETQSFSVFLKSFTTLQQGSGPPPHLARPHTLSENAVLTMTVYLLF